ncbi:MAG: tRNA (N6-threonylcarbamoyladenosine(37)-N6)-methyltransferase TrmO [Deltaproteobacteria bacterium]|nr:tRNA (N6-threonylcarbamoyladenosine(37)-N6)-methyltransferase TrmO [Deltaproteobacteria bacterium]
MTYRPVGCIHTPFKDIEGMPIQPQGAQGVAGQVEIFEPYQEGLRDLDGFSHLLLIYHLHLCRGYALRVKPFLDQVERGIFACRSPKRPNSIGLSIVRLIRIDGPVLHIEDVDMVDGTPLLDIKPYVPLFDTAPADRIGWFAGRVDGVFAARSDGRFRK